MNPEFRDRNIDYPVKIEFDERDNLYIAEFLDLPGCSASGSTVEEAYQEAQLAKQNWLRLAEKQGLPIPKPSRADEYSGRILLRLPTSLHAMLMDRAKMQATSLNQFTVHLLSAAVVGERTTVQIEQLRTTISSLEKQVSQLSKSMEVSLSALARQVAGALPEAVRSTRIPLTQRTGGSAYEASSGDTGKSYRLQ